MNMEQQLSVNLTIPIPEGSILITKVELEEMKVKSLTGKYWTMHDVEETTGKKHAWIKENILYPSKFRKILDVENGGFVFYPEVRGQIWSFQAVKMAEFLDEYFNQIFKGVN